VQAMHGSAVADRTEPSTVDEPAPARWLGRWYWALPALLTLVAAGWRLGTPSLWADELATWSAVRLGWGPLFRLSGHVDAVVAPYYVLEKLWAAVAGTSPVALRLPSALTMAAATALVAVLGTRVADRWVGLLSGVLFAVLPVTSRFAQEARPYAFVVLCAMVASLLLIRFMARPAVLIGLAYALTVALLGAFHLVGLLLLGAHAVVARRRLAAWAVWAGCGVLPVLPLVWFGTQQSGQVAWIPPARLHTVLAAPQDLFVSGAVAGALIALALLAFSRRWPVLALVSWAVVPLVTLAVVAQFTPLFWPRYLTYTVPAWVVLAAVTIGRLSRNRTIAMLAAVALLGAPAQTSIRMPDGHGQATRAAGTLIADHSQPGDAIAYSLLESAAWVPRDLVERYVPAPRRPRDVFAVSPQRVDGHLAARECADLAACLDNADPPRVWVVRMRTQADPLHGLGDAKEDLLRSRYHLTGLWLPGGLTVALYERG
jgi:mannosyltransferase